MAVFFDRMFDYVKDRSLKWLKIPGPKKEDVQAIPFAPSSDWQFVTYPGETVEREGQMYVRVNWQDTGEIYLAETAIGTYLYARVEWNAGMNLYQSDGKYYETEADALGQGNATKKTGKKPADPPPDEPVSE